MVKNMSKIEKARKMCTEIGELAKKYDLPVFAVTDGASVTRNNGCEAVRYHREQQIKWEVRNGFDPDEDWLKGYKK